MDGEMADTLFGMSRAQLAILPRAQRSVAYDALKRAFDYSVENGEACRAIAIGEQYLSSGDSGSDRGFDRLYERALQLVSPDSLSAGRILANYGRILGNDNNDYDSAQKAFVRGLEIAQREADAALEMRISLQSGAVNIRHLRLTEGVEECQRAIEPAQQFDDIGSERSARFNAAVGHLILGQVAEARPLVTAAVAASERIHDRQLTVNAPSGSDKEPIGKIKSLR